MPPAIAVYLDRYGARTMLFLANFGIARVVVYSIPLVIAALAPATVYGTVEFAQSVSLLGAALLIGAPLAGVSQRYLINREPLAIDVAAAAVGVSSIVALLAGGVAWIAQAPPLAIVSLLALALAAIHNSFATIFRTLTWRNVTAWSDGFAFIVTLAIVLGSLGMTGRVDIAAVGIGYALVAIAGLAGSAAILLRWRQAQLTERATRMISFGAPVLVSSGFAVWQAGAGRILAGLFVPVTLPAYAIAFRLVGLSLGIHQLATTALFSRMYSGRTKEIDRLLSILLAAAVLVVLAIIASTRLLVGPDTFAALKGDGYLMSVGVQPIVAVQVLFWIGNAMFEVRVTRFGLAKKTILPSAIINGTAVAGLFASRAIVPLTLPAICWVVAAQSAGFFFFSAWLLARRRVPHRKLTVVGAAGGVTLTLVALVLSNLA